MVLERFSLENKTAIITGAAGGLGRAMALSLAKAGASIVIADIQADAAKESAKMVSQIGRSALALCTDVTSSEQVNAMVQESISALGHIDILINNAGVVRGQRVVDLWELTDDEWQAHVAHEAPPYLAWHIMMMEYRLSGGMDNIADVLATNLLRREDVLRLKVIAKGKGFAPALMSLGNQAATRNQKVALLIGRILGGIILVLGASIAANIILGIYSIGSTMAQ